MTITLTKDQIDELGRELDAIKLRVVNDLGKDDLDYIYKVIKAQRALEVGFFIARDNGDGERFAHSFVATADAYR